MLRVRHRQVRRQPLHQTSTARRLDLRSVRFHVAAAMAALLGVLGRKHFGKHRAFADKERLVVVQSLSQLDSRQLKQRGIRHYVVPRLKAMYVEGELWDGSNPIGLELTVQHTGLVLLLDCVTTTGRYSMR